MQRRFFWAGATVLNLNCKTSGGPLSERICEVYKRHHVLHWTCTNKIVSSFEINIECYYCKHTFPYLRSKYKRRFQNRIDPVRFLFGVVLILSVSAANSVTGWRSGSPGQRASTGCQRLLDMRCVQHVRATESGIQVCMQTPARCERTCRLIKKRVVFSHCVCCLLSCPALVVWSLHSFIHIGTAIDVIFYGAPQITELMGGCYFSYAGAIFTIVI